MKMADNEYHNPLFCSSAAIFPTMTTSAPLPIVEERNISSFVDNIGDAEVNYGFQIKRRIVANIQEAVRFLKLILCLRRLLSFKNSTMFYLTI